MCSIENKDPNWLFPSCYKDFRFLIESYILRFFCLLGHDQILYVLIIQFNSPLILFAHFNNYSSNMTENIKSTSIFPNYKISFSI
jgi:hypothetical protein